MLLRKLTVLGLLATTILGACDPAPVARSATPALSSSGNPLAAPGVAMVPRSVATLVRDFTDLTFTLESGRPLPVFSRFEGPVTLRLAGQVPARAEAEAGALVARLRREAGVPISATTAKAASITVEFLPRRKLASVVPAAACFVAPNVSSWAEYTAARGTAQVDWTRVTQRTRMAVFIPSDASAQEQRDCLHEEVAQAMGPVNDLYRLPDSVFNDDNMQTVLTKFDMLMLRATYSPALRSGMSKAQVVAALPGVFAKIAPKASANAVATDATPRDYVSAIGTALGNAPAASRVRAAQAAVAIAQNSGWHDGRAGFAWFALGRSLQDSNVTEAFNAYAKAASIYRAQPGMEVQAAHVDLQMAALLVRAGRAQEALALVEAAMPVAQRAQNGTLVGSLQLVAREARRRL